MDRRHFLMGAAAAPATVRPSAAAGANDRIRVACVGFHSQGEVHIKAYLKIPNVEIAAMCDVDDAVLEKGCKMVEAAGKKRPATFSDFRKLLEDKSIDAVSIATPNFHHTLQTIWACQAGKDVYVEKPCSYNMFEARQIVAAARKYDRMVQHGTNGGSRLHRGGGGQDPRRADRRRLHGARVVLQRARHHRARRPRNRCPPGSTTTCGPDRRRRSRSPATGSTTTGIGSGTTATATSATRASIKCTPRAAGWASSTPSRSAPWAAISCSTTTRRRPTS